MSNITSYLPGVSYVRFAYPYVPLRPYLFCDECYRSMWEPAYSPYCADYRGISIGSVLLGTGQFVFREDLLSIDSPGISWSFSLDYMADSTIVGSLGKGFGYTQLGFLVQETDGSITYYDGSHIALRYAKETDTEYAMDNSSNDRILVTGSGADERYVMVGSSEGKTYFYGFDSAIKTPGMIDYSEDRFGNKLISTWEGEFLVKTTNSFGQEITYSYYDEDLSCRLKEIEDHLGRKINFQYDSEDRLVAVVSPSITKAPEGQELPNGSAYVFEYDKDNRREERQGDLIRVYYPNQTVDYISEDRVVDVEAVYKKATPRYSVEYGQDPADTNHYGKVIRETIGEAEPEHGAGGATRFKYISDLSELPTSIFAGDGPNDIVSRTIKTDPKGIRTIYDFNENGQIVREEIEASEEKISIVPDGEDAYTPGDFITWRKFNDENQIVLQINPEGDSIEYVYDDGVIDDGDGGTWTCSLRVGLLKEEIVKPGNSYDINCREGSNGQAQLVTKYFYDPIFNTQCSVIEPRGNLINCQSYLAYDFIDDNLNDLGSGTFTLANIGVSGSDFDVSPLNVISGESIIHDSITVGNTTVNGWVGDDISRGWIKNLGTYDYDSLLTNNTGNCAVSCFIAPPFSTYDTYVIFGRYNYWSGQSLQVWQESGSVRIGTYINTWASIPVDTSKAMVIVAGYREYYPFIAVREHDSTETTIVNDTTVRSIPTRLGGIGFGLKSNTSSSYYSNSVQGSISLLREIELSDSQINGYMQAIIDGNYSVTEWRGI